jgi:hypothetical protein
METQRVRAVFRCIDKKESESGDGVDIHMSAIADADGKYEEYFEATPYGEFEMGTINRAAADFFVPGKIYNLDFTPVE